MDIFSQCFFKWILHKGKLITSLQNTLIIFWNEFMGGNLCSSLLELQPIHKKNEKELKNIFIAGNHIFPFWKEIYQINKDAIYMVLTQWDLMMQICLGGLCHHFRFSCFGLSAFGLFAVKPLPEPMLIIGNWTNFMKFKSMYFFFKKKHLKILSANWLPFCRFS